MLTSGIRGGVETKRDHLFAGVVEEWLEIGLVAMGQNGLQEPGRKLRRHSDFLLVTDRRERHHEILDLFDQELVLVGARVKPMD